MSFTIANVCRSLCRDLKVLSASRKCISKCNSVTHGGAVRTTAVCVSRNLHVSGRRLEEEAEAADEEKRDAKADNPLAMKVVDVQTSIRYMKSNAYRRTYGDALVWQPYRRNQRGPSTRHPTRKTCIRSGILSTGNPCPVCRDVYLVVDPENTELLEQFICPNSGQILPSNKTLVCQEQQKKLTVALEMARDRGLIEKPVPFRKYDYTDYYPQLKNQASDQ